MYSISAVSDLQKARCSVCSESSGTQGVRHSVWSDVSGKQEVRRKTYQVYIGIAKGVDPWDTPPSNYREGCPRGRHPWQSLGIQEVSDNVCSDLQEVNDFSCSGVSGVQYQLISLNRHSVKV